MTRQHRNAWLRAQPPPHSRYAPLSSRRAQRHKVFHKDPFLDHSAFCWSHKGGEEGGSERRRTLCSSSSYNEPSFRAWMMG